jgi:tRNA threonylcarbamoyladenosine biosynthesis protein TsaB
MVKDMIILSADTSSDRFSLALIRLNQTIAKFNATACQRQSSDMLPEIERLLSESATDIKDIGCFCIGLGPGSFTGLRIGLTIFRAMAMVLKKPIIGIPSIDAMAYNARQYKNDLCIIVDAKQQKVYARSYRFRNGSMYSSGRIMLLGIKELLKSINTQALFLGDGIKTYRDALLSAGIAPGSLLPEGMWYPDAEDIAVLAKDKIRKRKKDNVFTLSPLYIYPKECQIKKARPAGIKSKVNR